MITEELIKTTNAYKIISTEKSVGKLSHAYLLVCSDGEYLREYLKIFAKLIQCETNGVCNQCRACKLIDKNGYADCSFYPKTGNKILTGDIEELTSEVYIKPLENKTRLFVLCNAENMTPIAQNKILKTLEEPPKNVCILIGATSDYTLLATVKSRVKKIDLPPFGESVLYSALKKEYADDEKLKRAVSLSGGVLSKAIKILNGESDGETDKLCTDILLNLNSSKDVYRYIDRLNGKTAEFITNMQVKIMEILRARRAGKQDNIKLADGALIAIERRLEEKEKYLYYSANEQMTIDGILFGIVEEKFKWQKL